MTLFKKEAWALFWALLLGLLLLAGAGAVSQTAPEHLKRDLNGDGVKESELLMKGGVIQRALVDFDLDGAQEMTIYYRNGLRDLATVDANGDGVVDTWIYFYFTGVPWKVAEDYNGDGRADYWLYLRDGGIYRWEQDRNGDGRPDLRTVGSSQRLDDDYDGIFERPAMGRKILEFVPEGLRRSAFDFAQGRQVKT